MFAEDCRVCTFPRELNGFRTFPGFIIFTYISNMTKEISNSNKIYEQRFEMLKKLIRIDQMLRSAKIIHKDKESKKDGFAG